MESTRRLAIELPEEMAEAVEARVASGQYASASDVVQEGLRRLAQDEAPLLDEEMEQWLRTEVVARYDAVMAGREEGLTIEQVRANLAEARARRNAAR